MGRPNRWPRSSRRGRSHRVSPLAPAVAWSVRSRRLMSGVAAPRSGSAVAADLAHLRTGDRPTWRSARTADGRPPAAGACPPTAGRSTSGTRPPAKMLAQLPVGNARVAFSPDGRWLGVGGEARYRFFRTGSWTPGPEIPHGDGGRQQAAGVPSRQPDRRDPGRESVDGAARRGGDRPGAGLARRRPTSRRPMAWPSAPMAASSRWRRPTSGCTSGTSP